VNTIKSLAIIALLAAAGFLLWANFNREPPPPPPDYTGDLEYEGGAPTGPQIEFSGAPGEDGPMVPDLSSATPPPSSSTPGAPQFGATGTGSQPPGLTSAPGTASAAAAGSASSVPYASATMSPQQGSASTQGTESGQAWPGASAATGAGTADALSGAADPSMSASSIAGVTGPYAPDGTSADPAAASTYTAACQEAQQLLDAGQLAEAHLLLSRWYGDSSLTPSEHDELVELLGQLAGSVIYSCNHYLEPPYYVKPGDTLESIAQQYNVSWQLLAHINGCASPDDVTVGQALKVVRGPFSAVVSLDRREMALLIGGRYAGRFNVDPNSDFNLMEGQWLVDQKQTVPIPQEMTANVAAGSQSSSSGGHFISLVNPAGGVDSPRIGIAGSEASSLVGDGGQGIIRLAPNDARDAFDILTVGSKVVIRR